MRVAVCATGGQSQALICTPGPRPGWAVTMMVMMIEMMMVAMMGMIIIVMLRDNQYYDGVRMHYAEMI